MTIVQAVILGIVQGLTEFLPVSSSGHLILMRELIGVGDIPVLFDVLLHVATLVAVLVVLRRPVADLLGVVWRWATRSARPDDAALQRVVVILIVATAITGVVGIGLNEVLDIRSPRLTSLLFLVTAAILLVTPLMRGSRELRSLRWRDSLAVGLAQGFGVLPGISRSGITISTSLFSGLDRATAGEFSFLLSIPAILGALVLTIGDAGELGQGAGVAAVVAGCIAALITGLLALVLLLRIVRAGRLHWFAAYLIPLGIWGLVTL